MGLGLEFLEKMLGQAVTDTEGDRNRRAVQAKFAEAALAVQRDLPVISPGSEAVAKPKPGPSKARLCLPEDPKNPIGGLFSTIELEDYQVLGEPNHAVLAQGAGAKVRIRFTALDQQVGGEMEVVGWWGENLGNFIFYLTNLSPENMKEIRFQGGPLGKDAERFRKLTETQKPRLTRSRFDIQKVPWARIAVEEDRVRDGRSDGVNVAFGSCRAVFFERGPRMLFAGPCDREKAEQVFAQLLLEDLE